MCVCMGRSSPQDLCFHMISHQSSGLLRLVAGPVNFLRLRVWLNHKRPVFFAQPRPHIGPNHMLNIQSGSQSDVNALTTWIYTCFRLILGLYKIPFSFFLNFSFPEFRVFLFHFILMVSLHVNNQNSCLKNVIHKTLTND